MEPEAAMAGLQKQGVVWKGTLCRTFGIEGRQVKGLEGQRFQGGQQVERISPQEAGG